MTDAAKPRLLFLRFSRPDLPTFVRLHLQEQVLCLSQYFDVIVNNGSCDYKQLCDMHKPDIVLLESSVYDGHRNVSNVSSHPTIPKLGFIHCDAFCATRKTAISTMARWGISTFFTTSVSLGSYTPSIADQLFVWPNFVNSDTYRDYGIPKVIPILFSGSQEPHYPWRNRIDRIVSQHYPSLHSPHFGWFWKKGKHSNSNFLVGDQYAQLINASWVAPTCGTIANEVVRKHFEIPACNTCLLSQKTAALEAAGFVDLVNCVLADDVEVLDKLDWLFQRPDELDRIIKAGKQLVASRHTMQHRDQILQWFTLHETLQPGQKIVQPGPFLPLTIVDESSGINNRHVMSGGLDRLLMNQADDKLRAGKYDEAEALYRRCLNYHYANIPEPKLKLVLCLLYKGNAKAALETVRKQFPDDRFTSDHGCEPDPTEWAYFIIALLCQGKNREAALRADQFTAIHDVELHRARCVVRILCGQTNEITNDRNHSVHRVSIHQLPKLSIEEWLQNLRTMLKACGQFETANILARGNSHLQFLEVNGYSKLGLRESPEDTIHTQNDQRHVNSQFTPFTKRFSNTVLKYYLMAVGRLNRSAQKLNSRFRSFFARRIVAHLPHRSSSRVADDDRATIVRLLRKEEIKSGVLIGAANGSWLSDAFMSGMQQNLHAPATVCMNYDTPTFRRFRRRFVDNANVEFRYLPNDGGYLFRQDGASDVIAVNCSEILENTRYEAPKAALVLLDGINKQAGHEIFRVMLSDKDYFLVVHEPSQFDGYAVFRRASFGTNHRSTDIEEVMHESSP